jgi:Protein of unknown function (DUF2442)
MSTSTNEILHAQASKATVNAEEIAVDLVDGRTIIAPLLWFPRLVHATPKERNNWRLIGKGSGIHWPDLDEDISISNLLLGQPSGESQQSLQKWLAGRVAAKKKKTGS